MKTSISRRQFLRRSSVACLVSLSPAGLLAEPPESANAPGLDFPPVDFHVHLDNSTLDKVLTLSRERHVRFGIVEHAGTRENKYPIVLSNDAELKEHLARLKDTPVYKGIQAEWTDWMSCFSPETLRRLDYVLSDAMTFPGRDGHRVKLWESGAAEQVDLADNQGFMDRYVDWHVEIMAKEPLDILANVSWLPPALASDYDTLWTSQRIQKVVDAAIKHRVALEISSSYKLPKLAFLKIAKAAGARFSFGSNGRYPNMGKLDYCLAMAKELGLKRADLFTPAPPGQRAVERKKLI